MAGGLQLAADVAVIVDFAIERDDEAPVGRMHRLRATRTEIDDGEPALAERHADFDVVAEQRYVRIVETGKTIPWSEMRGYLEARIAARPARRPAARKLAK